MKNICPMMQFRATVHVDAMRAVNARYILTAAVIFLFLGASKAGAECVFLKNGALIVGSIVRETGSTLTIKSADGALRVIQRGHVLRIFYTDIYLGKLVVRLTDGSVMEAYMVDENADFYTFRDRLDNPAEF